MLEVVETAHDEEGGGGVGKGSGCLRCQQGQRNFLLRGEASRELKSGGPQYGCESFSNSVMILRLQYRLESSDRLGFVWSSRPSISLTSLVVLQQSLLEAVEPPVQGVAVEPVKHGLGNTGLQ